MMRIKEFARLRKQNDMVKIALLFLLIGMGFFVSTVWNGVQFMQSTNERTEYILGQYNEVTKEDITKFLHMEGVSSVSRTFEQMVNVKYKNKISSIVCTVVTKDYIEDMLDVECNSYTKTFYLNQAALDLLNRDLLLYEEYGTVDEQGMFLVEEGTVMSMRYMLGEEGNATYKTADLVLVEDVIHGDEASVWTYTDDIDLTHKATSVRLLMNRKQIDGTFQTSLMNMGFSVENEVEMLRWEAEIEMRMLKMEYGIWVSLLSLTAGSVVLKRELKILKH